jgi:hypothetical protein
MGRVRSPHHLVLVLFALCVNSLLYSVLYSIVGLRPDRAAEIRALIAFLVTAVVSYAFKRFIEE